MHVVPDNGWTFDGHFESPTFAPSVKITYNGPDADQPGKPAACCHYNLVAGELQFCEDCTHTLVGKNVALATLPDHMKDWS